MMSFNAECVFQAWSWRSLICSKRIRTLLAKKLGQRCQATFAAVPDMSGSLMQSCQSKPMEGSYN